MFHYDVYRDQLAKLGHGHALWEPDPGGLYHRVEVGDVGYVRQGHFQRLFNILLPEDHESHSTFGVPDGFEPLNVGSKDLMRVLTLRRGDHCSNNVHAEEVSLGAQFTAGATGNLRASYFCSKKQGALLSLPSDAERQDTPFKKRFAKYMVKHCDSWLDFVLGLGVDVERLEDLILVTGCDKTTDWGMAVFTEDQSKAHLSLAVDAGGGVGASVRWSVRQAHSDGVAYHFQPRSLPRHLQPNQCLFIRGFRAKKYAQFLPKRLIAASEMYPDAASTNSGDDEFSASLLSLVSQTDGTSNTVRGPMAARSIEDVDVTAGPETVSLQKGKYLDPIEAILQYMMKNARFQHPQTTVEIAIAHDDDLKLMEGLDVFNGPAVLEYLEHHKPELLLTPSGTMSLQGGWRETKDRTTMTLPAGHNNNIFHDAMTYVQTQLTRIHAPSPMRRNAEQLFDAPPTSSTRRTPRMPLSVRLAALLRDTNLHEQSSHASPSTPHSIVNPIQYAAATQVTMATGSVSANIPLSTSTVSALQESKPLSILHSTIPVLKIDSPSHSSVHNPMHNILYSSTTSTTSLASQVSEIAPTPSPFRVPIPTPTLPHDPLPGHTHVATSSASLDPSSPPVTLRPNSAPANTDMHRASMPDLSSASKAASSIPASHSSAVGTRARPQSPPHRREVQRRSMASHARRRSAPNPLLPTMKRSPPKEEVSSPPLMGDSAPARHELLSPTPYPLPPPAPTVRRRSNSPLWGDVVEVPKDIPERSPSPRYPMPLPRYLSPRS